MSDNKCPKCGAHEEDIGLWVCGTIDGCNGLDESPTCLRSQLAQLEAVVRAKGAIINRVLAVTTEKYIVQYGWRNVLIMVRSTIERQPERGNHE